MIWHQTVTQNIAMWQNKFPYFFQKEKVIIGVKENLLLVITPVVNVV